VAASDADFAEHFACRAALLDSNRGDSATTDNQCSCHFLFVPCKGVCSGINIKKMRGGVDNLVMYRQDHLFSFEKRYILIVESLSF
jgi:hypothetical protein